LKNKISSKKKTKKESVGRMGWKILSVMLLLCAHSYGRSSLCLHEEGYIVSHAIKEAIVDFTLHSPSFKNGEEIPSMYTCEGKDVSPPLSWSEPPKGTVSFALIVDDPDAPDPAAPKMTWVHWVLYNMPASTRSLKEGVRREEMPVGTQEGINDYHRTTYGGPCPPIGRHRYYFKLYALSKEISGLKTPTKKELEKAMEGCVLGKAELVGTYRKK
jgi:Raf kinase inhibitor-like YbhB/YbcL family protein